MYNKKYSVKIGNLNLQLILKLDSLLLLIFGIVILKILNHLMREYKVGSKG